MGSVPAVCVDDVPESGGGNELAACVGDDPIFGEVGAWAGRVGDGLEFGVGDESELGAGGAAWDFASARAWSGVGDCASGADGGGLGFGRDFDAAEVRQPDNARLRHRKERAPFVGRER